MFGRFSARGLVLVPVLMALLLAAQPAAAFSFVSSTGTPGLYGESDIFAGPQGADCVYQSTKSHHVYPLKDINVHGPYIYGKSSHHRWVGWRYRIQRDTNHDNVFGTFFTSSVVKAKANNNAPASFPVRKWTPPATLKEGNYRVQLTLYWYASGSSTVVDSKIVGLIQYYKMKGGGNLMVRTSDCYSTN